MSILVDLKLRGKYLLPVWLKKGLKYLLYSCQDFADFVKGKKSKFPPRRLNFVGSSQFEAVGKEFFDYLKKYADLQPGEKVLDVGCGIGRIALPLAEYLDKKGRYSGFDIDKRGIAWCQKHISADHKHFEFQHADIYNRYYNRGGAISAEGFTFPYPDKNFDLVFAVSVFTHMLPSQVTRYFSEITRVLKPGGRVLLTFFLLDEEAKKLIANGSAKAKFVYTDDQVSFYSHKGNPEAEVAYLQTWIQEQLQSADLIDHQLYSGSWSGKNKPVSYQDILVARKKED
ncbi:MAG: methyltransferase domain-containing protein [bacterium]|nr:methyltransferase domain-containing protein [bacterium]